MRNPESRGAEQQAKRVRFTPSDTRDKPRQDERDERCDPVVKGEHDTDPVGANVVGKARGVGSSAAALGDCGNYVDPHREQAKPGEELNHRQPPHYRGHMEDIVDDLEKAGGSNPAACTPGGHPLSYAEQQADAGDQVEFARIVFECGHSGNGSASENPQSTVTQETGRTAIRPGRPSNAFAVARELARRSLARCGDRDPGTDQQPDCADRKCGAQRSRQNSRRRYARHAQTREQPWQDRGNHRSGADEAHLRRIGERPLFLRNGVGDERPERLHGDVDRTGKQPQHEDRCPQAVNIGHQDESNRAHDRAAEDIGAPPAERAPCPIAQMTDDRLNEQAR